LIYFLSTLYMEREKLFGIRDAEPGEGGVTHVAEGAIDPEKERAELEKMGVEFPEDGEQKETA